MNYRKSLLVKTALLASKAPLHTLLPFERILTSLQFFGNPPLVRPIIILALPRSGSTLAFQCLIHRYRLNYLSNLWHIFYRLPFIGGLLSGSLLLLKRPSSRFFSSYGFVPGMLGPAEGFHFWSHWLGSDLSDSPYVGTNKERSIYIYSVLSRLSKHFPPFATCYLGHVLCIKELHALFPDAIFVRVHRNPLSNALSILKCIREFSVDWFSVLPDECLPFIHSSEHIQAAAQCYFLNKRIDHHTLSIPCFNLHYEELCRDPRGTMRSFHDFAESQGLTLSSSLDLPESFPITPISPDDIHDLELLRKAFLDLESSFGPMS